VKVWGKGVGTATSISKRSGGTAYPREKRGKVSQKQKEKSKKAKAKGE
jgi:hypothetical protein